MIPRTLLLCAAAGLALAATGAPTAAQVPDGHIVIASLRYRQLAPGSGGLFLAHPRAPSSLLAVSGLPATLTGAGLPEPQGALSVARNPRDERLAVGEAVPPGGSFALHVLTLAGASLASDQVIPVGTVYASAPHGGIDACAWLPSGEILFTARNMVPAPPLNGATVAIADPATGAVRPVQHGAPPYSTALALSRDGDTLYIGTWQSWFQSTIFEVDLASASTQQIATLPTGIVGMDLDNQGRVVCSALDPARLHHVYRLTPATPPPWTMETLRQAGPQPWLDPIRVERATGDYVYAGFGGLMMGAPGVPPALVAAPPSGGWGLPQGIDVNHDPEPYGAGTPTTANSYDWQVEPSAAGLPLLGNAGFGLEVLSSSSPPALSAALLGSAALQSPLIVAGLAIHVDPFANLVVLPMVPSGQSATLALPIPANPVLSGIPLFAQSVHIDTGGLGSSSGLVFTPL